MPTRKSAGIPRSSRVLRITSRIWFRGLAARCERPRNARSATAEALHPGYLTHGPEENCGRHGNPAGALWRSRMVHSNRTLAVDGKRSPLPARTAPAVFTAALLRSGSGLASGRPRTNCDAGVGPGAKRPPGEPIDLRARETARALCPRHTLRIPCRIVTGKPNCGPDEPRPQPTRHKSQQRMANE